MKCFFLLIGCLAIASAATATGQGGAQGSQAGTAVPKFDPTRDPAKDLVEALGKAKKSGRNVLLDVGGEWCSWCHLLDKFFEDHAALKALRDRSYVLLKVNFSQENKNERFLSAYPTIKGYPHLFVLDPAGKLLHSQDTGLLEEGRGYNLAKVEEFLRKWAPKAKR